MAPTTPLTEGRYSGPMIQILVGKRREPFNIHQGVLEKTAFFEVHGEPPRTQPPTPSPARHATLNSPAPSEGTLGPENPRIKQEDGVDEYEVRGNNDAAPNVSTLKNELVYRLEGRIYEPDAFHVVMDYLYSVPPSTPRSHNQVQTLLKTYILALQYRMTNLQDNLVDCLRHFHTAYHVTFADLQWLASTIGEDKAVAAKVPLIQYLLDQIAFEIYQRGYDAFARDSQDFEIFLTHDKHPLRRELFKSMARVGGEKNKIDPAQGPNRWRVVDYPGYQQGDIQRETTAELIELDE